MVKITANNCQNVRKVLFLAATKMELKVVSELYGTYFPTITTGVGAVSTTLATLRAIEEHKPDMVVQIGIAGAISRDLAIGEVTEVLRDFDGDLGAFRSEDNCFISLCDTRYQNCAITKLRGVTARTVNMACSPLLEANAQIESMEGSAFMAAASSCGVMSLQLRAISNYTGDNRDSWDIPKALEELKKKLEDIFIIK